MSESSVFFHLHIPKTAGSLFNLILRKNFGNQFIHENPYLSTQQYSETDIRAMLNFYSFRAYAGHVFRLNNIPFDDVCNLTCISFVRDPIEKYFSFYFFQRSRIESNDKAEAKLFGLETYIDWQITNQNQLNPMMVDSGQLEWVSGSRKMNEELESYLKSGKYLIFPSDRFLEACLVLEKKFPRSFRNCSFHSDVNVSVRDQEISNKCTEKVKMFPWIQPDMAFHRRANEMLDEMIASCFATKEDFNRALEELNRRNSQLRKNNSMKSRIKRRIVKVFNL